VKASNPTRIGNSAPPRLIPRTSSPIGKSGRLPNVDAIAPGSSSQKARRPSPTDEAKAPCSKARRKIAAQRRPGSARETALPMMSFVSCPGSITEVRVAAARGAPRLMVSCGADGPGHRKV
jgi:hypothetical protein